MGSILDQIEAWIKGVLVEGIMDNLKVKVQVWFRLMLHHRQP